MTEDKVDPVFAERRDVLSKETERQAILLAKIEDILKLESDKLTRSRKDDLSLERDKLTQNLETLYEAIYDCKGKFEDPVVPLWMRYLEQNRSATYSSRNKIIRSISVGYDRAKNLDYTALILSQVYLRVTPNR